MANVSFECPCARHIEINNNNIPSWHEPNDVYQDVNIYFVPPTGQEAFEEKLEEIFGE